jgi:hypothetical protein
VSAVVKACFAFEAYFDRFFPPPN